MNDVALVKIAVGVALVLDGAVLQFIAAKIQQHSSKDDDAGVGCVATIMMLAGMAALFWGLSNL
jgi:hypothetical protein